MHHYRLRKTMVDTDMWLTRSSIASINGKKRTGPKPVLSQVDIYGGYLTKIIRLVSVNSGVVSLYK